MSRFARARSRSRAHRPRTRSGRIRRCQRRGGAHNGWQLGSPRTRPGGHLGNHDGTRGLAADGEDGGIRARFRLERRRLVKPILERGKDDRHPPPNHGSDRNRRLDRKGAWLEMAAERWNSVDAGRGRSDMVMGGPDVSRTRGRKATAASSGSSRAPGPRRKNPAPVRLYRVSLRWDSPFPAPSAANVCSLSPQRGQPPLALARSIPARRAHARRFRGVERRELRNSSRPRACGVIQRLDTAL